MADDADRSRALRAVVELAAGWEQALDALARTRFDGESEPKRTLTRGDIRRVLRALDAGDLSASQTERWAERGHLAEDLEFDPDDLFVVDAVFELSTLERFGSRPGIVTDLLVQSEGSPSRPEADK